MWFIFETLRACSRADGPHPSTPKCQGRKLAICRVKPLNRGTTPFFASFLAALVISGAIFIKLIGPDPKWQIGRFSINLTCHSSQLAGQKIDWNRHGTTPTDTTCCKLASTVPFTGPETLELQRGKPFLARIGANESSFGPAPSVIEAIQQEVGEIWKYGDPENYELRHAIAAHHGVKPENIMPGAGVDALLGLVVRQYVQSGDRVINSLGGYPTFNYHVAGYGGALVTVPYTSDRPDLDGLLNAARKNEAAILYVANPDNPMGTWHEGPDIQSFIERVPETTMLILDEAYCETGPASAFPPFETDRPNILRMRTFSKAYGLAGIRCGYVVGSADAIKSFDKIRDHFAVNRLAQAAAIAALGPGLSA